MERCQWFHEAAKGSTNMWYNDKQIWLSRVLKVFENGKAVDFSFYIGVQNNAVKFKRYLLNESQIQLVLMMSLLPIPNILCIELICSTKTCERHSEGGGIARLRVEESILLCTWKKVQNSTVLRLVHDLFTNILSIIWSSSEISVNKDSVKDAGYFLSFRIYMYLVSSGGIPKPFAQNI